MALKSESITVADSATAVFAFTNEIQRLWVTIPTGGNVVYLGGAGVTTSTGMPLIVGAAPVEIAGDPGDTLYGVVASGTQALKILGSGR